MGISTSSKAYSNRWQLGTPFTILTKDNGELCTPRLWTLPCGDLLVTYSDDGDFGYARWRATRSRDSGKTWQEDVEVLSAPAFLSLDRSTTRMYEFHSFAVKESKPSRFLFRYRDSIDDGRTFGPNQYAAYEHDVERGPCIGDGEKIHTLFHNLIHWEDVLTAAGWEKLEWLNAQTGYHGPSYFTHFIRFNDGSLGHVVNLQSDGAGSTATWHLHLLRSTDGGVTWHHRSRITPLVNPSNASEGCPVRLANGRLHVVFRYPPDHRKVRQTWSEDDGLTWSEPTILHDHVCGIVPAVHRLADGALMLVYGRPGMWIMFDPTGTTRGWEVERRFDLTRGEELTLRTNAPVKTARLDLLYYKRYCDPYYASFAPKTLFADGLYYYSWENVNAREVSPGRVLAVYDVQNFVEVPSGPARKAIRGVWLTRTSA